MSTAKRIGTQIGLGGLRSLTGLLQGGSGLVDLIAPGQGTSRVSKGLQNFGRTIDQTASAEAMGNLGLHAAYQGGQGATDLLTLFGGGLGAAKAGATVATKIPGATKIAGIAARPLGILDAGNAAQRLTATGLRTLRPSQLINTGANAALDAGQQAAQGETVTPQGIAGSIAASLGMNTGVPIVAHAAGIGLKTAVPMVGRGLQETSGAAFQGGQGLGMRLAGGINDAIIGGLNVKPHRHIPDAAVEAARRVRQHQQGINQDIEPSDHDFELYKLLQRYTGAADHNPEPLDRIILDRQTYDMRGRGGVIQQQRAVQHASR